MVPLGRTSPSRILLVWLATTALGVPVSTSESRNDEWVEVKEVMGGSHALCTSSAADAGVRVRRHNAPATWST
ncbi:hypothetical protein DAEQUDRAFT_722953 [Daedalea quercina L-15889]|uniref:Secreted protein n=1 Tax=Daedalea quercina L-15889 TaxID=1314783 RepID=A0A165SP78_9APHY|nr:hypothetical protein DAEQUDRAFT_722953 [Daedalea quercina L-15889]